MWISEENQAHSSFSSSPRRIYKEKEDDHSTATPASVSERTRDRPMCVCVWLILGAVRGSISARNPIEPMMMIADEAEERKKRKKKKLGECWFLGNGAGIPSIPSSFFFLRLRVCWMHLALMIQSDQSLSLTHSLSLSPCFALYKFLLTHTILSRFLSLSRFLFLFFIRYSFFFPLSSGDSDCICHIENPTIRPSVDRCISM